MRITTLPVWFVVGSLTLAGCFAGGDGGEDDGGGDGTSSGPWLPGGGGGGIGGDAGGGGNANADDDGDGFTNGEEEEAGTNPDYDYSHPYTGGYNVGFCADGIAEGTPGPSGSTYSEGDIAENFTLMDQHGEDVDLYSFCGQTVMLVTGAFW